MLTDRRSFLISAGATAASLAATARPALAADTVRVGVGAVYPLYAVFFATRDLGYYREQNLEVDIQQFRGGPAAQEALAANAVDIISLVPAAASLAIEKGVKEKLIAYFAPPTPAGWYIMVLASSPYKSMADLNGKTIGVTQKGSLTDFWVQRVAKASNVTVNTIPLGGGVEAGLRAKQVDAAILWPIFSYKGIIDNELRPVAELENVLKPTVSEAVVAGDDMIAKKPDVIRRWLGATAKGLSYMQTHESWSVDYLKKYFDEKDERAAKMVFSNYIKKMHADGEMKPDWQRDALELGAAAGAGTSLSPDKVFSTAFVPIKVPR